MSNETKAPRPGREFWDKLNALPRYMFLLKPSDVGIQKLEDSTGNWIDVHEAQQVVDQAQEEINQLRAERDALQLRLNGADQRADDLETELKVTKQALNSLKGEREDQRASKEQCQFPQSCTTRCDCTIPDFSPGSGNQGRLPCTCKPTESR